MSPEELYAGLARLSDEQLDALCADIVPDGARAHLPPPNAARAQRAQALIDFARQSPDALERLRAILVDPVALWLACSAQKHRWVRVVGFQDRYKIELPLDNVFVSLALRPRRRDEALKASGAAAEREAFAVDEPREVQLERALALSRELPDAAGVVILGDPGAGKTTLLKHLYARVARDGSASVGLSPSLCPVYIRCGGILEGELKPFGLREVIQRDAEREGYAEAGRRLVSERRPVLFLLDGLDEVRDRSMRGRVCDWLGEEVAHWSGSRFVATCRFAAFQEAGLSNRFLRVDVLWLDEPRVRDYVHRWFRAVEHGLAGLRAPDRAPERAAEKAESLLRVVLDPERQRNVRLREMTENPLLLSTLCLVHHSGLKFPDKRGELYDRCISLLLETWAAHAGRTTLPDGPTRIVLRPLAHAMHERGVEELPAEEVESIVAGPLGQVPAIKQLPAKEFLEIARDQCGVLASRDVGSYRFFHLSFQEYLCAAHIKESGLAAVLAGRASDPWWKEVVLLAVSMPGVLGPLLRALIEGGRLGEQREIVRACLDETIQMDEAPFVEVLDREIARMERPQRGLGAWWRRITGPSEPDLALTVRAVLEVTAGRELPGVMERARRLVSHPDAGVSAAARAMVRGPEVEQVTVPAAADSVWREPITGMTFVWAPPGRFLMGSSKTPGEPGFDPVAHDDETPAHEVELTEGIWMGEHPVTNACYGAFLVDTKQQAPDYWQDRRFNGPEQPVVGVGFEGALAFCAWLTRSAGLRDGFRFDLPAEAEWEHAARGADARRYPWGNDAPTAEHACFEAWDKGAPAPVGGRPAGRSQFGCHDMAGNVWEWCLDAWCDSYVDMVTKRVNPCHPGDRGAPRVVRGGSWNFGPGDLRCAVRLRCHPGRRDDDLGFRVVCRGSRQPAWLVGS